jgi:hypothetical protein
MAESYNITPWKWITRFVISFFGSVVALCAVLLGIYGPNVLKDTPALETMSIAIGPFIWLYQFILFYFFRSRIVRYVHNLDEIERQNNNNKFPDPPAKGKKEQKDFSYFR